MNRFGVQFLVVAPIMKHAYDTDLKDSKGEKSANRVLTDAMVIEILTNPQIKNIEFAKRFSIDRSAISKVRTKKNWSHISNN